MEKGEWKSKDEPLWRAWWRQRGGLQEAMRTEAGAAILTIEGLENGDLDPGEFGNFATMSDGTVVFSWRGQPVLNFSFEPGMKAGQGLQLKVDRLYLAKA